MTKTTLQVALLRMRYGLPETTAQALTALTWGVM